ncbi:MAG: T9SS type A sorting domain-containing protein [Ignavibacteriales bacterium]|nr:T9SS type A sorting domain-containing protein [Ignavibacteriales bacterium]
MVCAQGSSSAPTAEPYVYFNGGLLVTGDFAFIHLSTTSATVSAGTPTSYVVGNMGRAMSSSAGKLGTFPIGDINGYRPVQVKSSTSGVATGHYLRINCVAANANTGSSAFPDNLIDKVSAVRYYKVTYGKLIAAAADSMGVDHFRPSYFSGDGVVAGNQDLRVAYSTDNRATWTTLHDNYPDTTKIGTDPFRYYYSDTLANAHFLTISQNALYFALARLTGTTTNTLDPGNSIERGELSAVTFNLEQNYPNPFNPATKISYNLPNADFVNLKIYDIVGNEVATLLSGYQSAGHYTYSFNASSLTSGVYFYTLKTSRFSETKKMLLTK